MSTPAGWYPDPSAPDALRWWDGGRWTEHVHRAATTSPPQPWLSKAPTAPQQARSPYGAPHRQYPPSQYPVPGVKAIATPDGQALGGLGSRLLARIVDWILLGVIGTIAAWSPLQTIDAQVRSAFDVWMAGDPERGSTLIVEATRSGAASAATFILLAVSAVYTILTVRLAGATPGKLLFRLRVRDWQRPGLPSWGQAIIRWLGCDLLGQVVPFYSLIDFLWPCWDQRKQALHDKMGRTVVVRKR
ncbi:RDD family protein [Kineococcus sp. GCM10028916]|uniref:RDD family protein n=1 Tax=Kineococcus sp. GCM10028916 TaxID=3273394 RepID=UPI00363FDA82